MIRFLSLPAVALAAVTAACNRAPPPLQGLSGITRIQIRTTGPELAKFTLVLTDPVRLNAITQTLNSDQGGWHGSDWETPPAGDISAGFYRGDSLVGVLWVGDEFLAERGVGERLLKSISSQREAQIRRLLDPRLAKPS